MICPFLNKECLEYDCELYNVANEKCAIALIAEIKSMQTNSYRPTSEMPEPMLVKVVD